MSALRRAGAVLRSAWLIAGVFLVMLLMVDCAATRWANARDQRDLSWRLASDAYRAEPWAHDLWPEYGRLEDQWEPFAYYRLKPFAGRFHNIDAAGRRQTWNAPPAPGATTIAVFGGSTAWGFGERDEGTIPSLLSHLLSEAGHAVQVENRAQVGYVSTQEVIALLRSLPGAPPPRVVLFYDGFNDLLSLVRNRRAGVSLDEQGRADSFEVGRHPGRLLDLLAGHSGILRLCRYAPPPQSGGSIDPADADRLIAEMVEAYAANVRLVEEAGRVMGFESLFFWQPTLHSPKKRQSPFEARMAALEKGFTKALHERAHRAIVKDARLAADARFFDLDDSFAQIDEPLFIDRAHLNQAGNLLIAQRIRDHLVPVLVRLQPAR